MTWSLPEGDAAVGLACGSFGELLQGALPGGRGDFLVTLPIELHSVARFVAVPDSSELVVDPWWKTKSRELARVLLQRYGAGAGGRLYLASEIPCGKGLSSSSADLVATARAVEAHLEAEISVEELCRLLSEIEPTDGVMFPESVIYLHMRGALLERLGALGQVEVLSLDEGGEIETLEYHRRGAVEYTRAEQQTFQDLLGRLRRAFASRDLDEIGAVSTASADINQRFNPKRHLDLVRRVCAETGGAGLIATHSGTCVGILYDTRKTGHAENRERARDELRDHGQVEIYKTLARPLTQLNALNWSRREQA